MSISKTVFISYSHDDKEDIARPIFQDLNRRGIPVLLDEDNIRSSDSIPGWIDRAILEASVALLIISPSYLKKSYTLLELDTLIDQASANRIELFFIFHKITVKELREIRPSLAMQYGYSTTEGTSEVVAKIVEDLGLEKKTPGRLILMAGVAGAGKTLFARLMAARIDNAVLIDKNAATRVFTDPLMELLPFSNWHLAESSRGEGDRESDAYLTYVRRLEYKALLELVEDNIASGKTVIVSAPFLKEVTNPDWLTRQRNHFKALYGAELRIVYLHVSSEIAYTRLKSRGARRDLWKLSQWTEYTENFPQELKLAGPGLTIENSSNEMALLLHQLPKAIDYALK